MIRTYLYSATAAVALVLTGCSQDEVVSMRQDGIGYNVFAMNQTRAADSYCNNNLPGSFKVWAQIPGGNLYINNDEIKNENGKWIDVNGTRYWPQGKKLNFFAHVNGDGNFKFNNGAPTFDGFVVNDDVEKQLDLMYAVNKGEEGDGVSNNGSAVSLNFRHALSQVCFRAKNSTKNLDITIKSITVGHLTNGGTYTFPSENTDKNIVDADHDNVDDGMQDENRGSWVPNTSVNNKAYTAYTDDSKGEVGVKLETSDNPEIVNLTLPTVGHKTGWQNVLTLMPQEVEAWNPSNKGTDYNGAYFLLEVDMVDDESKVPVHSGQLALPVDINWKEGYRYIYTFIFGEGTNGGWTPDPNNPQPVLSAISYTVSVDDFIPVYGDGAGTEVEAYKNIAKLKLNSNYPNEENKVETVTVKSNNDNHTIKLNADLTPEAPEGYYFAGWSTEKEGSVEYEEGADFKIDFLKKEYELYAKWEEGYQLTYDSNGVDIADMVGQKFPVSQHTGKSGGSLLISDIVPKVILSQTRSDSNIRDNDIANEMVQTPQTRMIVQHNLTALSSRSGIDLVFVGWSTDPNAEIVYEETETNRNDNKVARYTIKEDYEAYYPSSVGGSVENGKDKIKLSKHTKLYAIWSATAQVIYKGSIELIEKPQPATRMTVQHNIAASAVGFNDLLGATVKKCVFTYPGPVTFSVDDVESNGDHELLGISPTKVDLLEENQEYNGPLMSEVSFYVNYKQPETFTKIVYPVCRKKSYKYKVTWVDGDKSTEQTIIKNTRQFNLVLDRIPEARSGQVFKGWSTANGDLNKRVESHTFDLLAMDGGSNATFYACWEEGTPKTLTVVYTDGVEGETVFADQEYEDLTEGKATPEFVGIPQREGYIFIGWIRKESYSAGSINPILDSDDAMDGKIVYKASWLKIGNGGGLTLLG